MPAATLKDDALMAEIEVWKTRNRAAMRNGDPDGMQEAQRMLRQLHQQVQLSARGLRPQVSMEPEGQHQYDALMAQLKNNPTSGRTPARENAAREVMAKYGNNTPEMPQTTMPDRMSAPGLGDPSQLGVAGPEWPKPDPSQAVDTPGAAALLQDRLAIPQPDGLPQIGGPAIAPPMGLSGLLDTKGQTPVEWMPQMGALITDPDQSSQFPMADPGQALEDAPDIGNPLRKALEQIPGYRMPTTTGVGLEPGDEDLLPPVGGEDIPGTGDDEIDGGASGFDAFGLTSNVGDLGFGDDVGSTGAPSLDLRQKVIDDLTKEDSAKGGDLTNPAGAGVKQPSGAGGAGGAGGGGKAGLGGTPPGQPDEATLERRQRLGMALMGMSAGILTGGQDLGAAIGKGFEKAADGFLATRKDQRQASLNDSRINNETARLDMAREQMAMARERAARQRAGYDAEDYSKAIQRLTEGLSAGLSPDQMPNLGLNETQIDQIVKQHQTNSMPSTSKLDMSATRLFGRGWNQLTMDEKREAAGAAGIKIDWADAGGLLGQ